MTRVVAALYVDPRGPYPTIRDVECWDETRDARRYDGPHPVVAHPPCGPWSKLRHLYKGSGRECAEIAIEQVRAYGGVLEHPAGSTLWRYCGLPPANDVERDQYGGWSLAVEQVRWGHVARKRTWLYIVGVDADNVGPIPPPREPTHWIGGYRASSKTNPTRQGKPIPPGIKACSHEQTRRTPRAFAEWLLAIARASKR